MNYSEAMQAHDARIRALFRLYDDQRFDEMLEQYCEDVVCFLPTVLAGDLAGIQWSFGKAQYRANLEVFYRAFGKLEVGGIFATPEGSSVLVTDAHGNSGTFSFEVTPDRRVSRVFFHHQPGRAKRP